MRMNSSNPVFSSLEKQKSFSSVETATKDGIAIKTFLLLAITIGVGFTSVLIPENILMPALIISSIVTFIAAMTAIMVPKTASYMSVVYSAGQGLLYGTMTYLLESFFPGIALTAMIATGTIFTVMLVLYKTGVLRGSPLLRSIVMGSLITVLVSTLIISIISLVNPSFIAGIQSFELMVGISLFMIILGAFMLTLDFERADQIVNSGLPKQYEWTAALGFMITLIWIYYNILRLLAIIASRNNN